MKRNIYIYIVYTCRRSLYSSSSNFSFPPFPFFLPFLLPLSIKKSPRRGAPFGKKGIVGRSAPSKLHIARKLPSILRPHGIKRVFSLGDERRIEDISILFFYDPLVELYNSNCTKRLLWRNWYPYQSCSRCGTTTKTDSFFWGGMITIAGIQGRKVSSLYKEVVSKGDERRWKCFESKIRDKIAKVFFIIEFERIEFELSVFFSFLIFQRLFYFR